MKCPICAKQVPAGGEFIPFCSERCKLIDLGNWASEKYKVSTPGQPSGEESPESESPGRSQRPEDESER